MTLKEEVAVRLLRARQAQAMTQKELAAAIGMPFPSLRNYESAKQIPGGEALRMLMKAGINANWLLTGEGPMRLEDVVERPASPVREEIARIEGEMADHHRLMQLRSRQAMGITTPMAVQEPGAPAYANPTARNPAPELVIRVYAAIDDLPGAAGMARDRRQELTMRIISTIQSACQHDDAQVSAVIDDPEALLGAARVALVAIGGV